MLGVVLGGVGGQLLGGVGVGWVWSVGCSVGRSGCGVLG